MMRTYNILIILLLAGCMIACDTKDTVDPTYDDYFIKFLGNEGDQTGAGIFVDPSGIYTVGNTSIEGGNSRIYMVKSDFQGNFLWDRTFDFSGSLTTVGMVRDQAGNIYVAANLEVEEDIHDIYVMKTDANGAKISEATYFVSGGSNPAIYNDIVESISVNSNDQILLTGWTTNVMDKELPSNISDVYSLLISTDLVPVSDAEWRQLTGFRESMDMGKKIIQARAGGRYFFIGTTDKADGTGITAQTNLISFPLQSDGQFPSGDVINGTTSIETASDIASTSGGDVVAMWNSSTGFNSSTIYLAYANEEQDYMLQSGQSLPFNSAVGRSIIQSKFGGFIILGEQINNNTSDIFLVRIDQNLEVIWQKTLGGLENESARQVAELEDGSIVITGTVVLESQSKMFLIKTKPNGDLNP